MKKILGLDLGTNSIGWAVVNAKEENRENETSYLKPVNISAAGSRIIPMDAGILSDFDKGTTKSQTADRTTFRGVRRLHERNLQRRERLLRVLKLMGFLPEHFASQIDEYGKFINHGEPKLAWCKDEQGKFEFVFKDSFEEMLEDFAQHQPQLVADGKKVPYDWTIYYLRKKALTQRLTKEELAWVLLQFNQKRGYYQLRGEEEEEKSNETIEIISAKILSVERKEKDKKYEKYWYEMPLDNGLTYRAAFYNDVSAWKDETKEFVLKTTILKDGSKKEELSFLPTPDEIERMDAQRKGKMYAKIKLRTEKNILDSNKTVGCYIYDNLLQAPNQKIIGKLVRTVERKYYKEELQQILEKQVALTPELKDATLYNKCIEELYPNNEAHRNNIAKPDFANLFINDILFYQRPLKSKKSLINNCPYEPYDEIFYYKKDENGNYIKDENGQNKKFYVHIKCIAKSNPLFQEFRLWQFVQNLRIYQREKNVDGKLQTDVDVTKELLKTEENYVKLFDWLNDRASIKQEMLLTYFEKKKDKDIYRWNYVEDKEYPCNKTRAAILAKLAKTEKEKLSSELTFKIWHLLYSVSTKAEIDAVFSESKRNKQNRHKNGKTTDGVYKTLLDTGFSSETINKLKNIKFDEKDYGSYSEKAIKKLLPLMRMGKYWSAEAIDDRTKERIDKILTGEYDENIKNRVREKSINLTDINHFRALPVWLACYIVYDRHSEAKEIGKWEKPEDIDTYLKGFKQHSLRNPIVEQVVTETLRTVRDIWKQEEQIDEIHLELGREMKNPADKRKKMTEHILENENTNLRIKALLMEFANPEMGIENVRPYSPSQQDILRIYEENALDNLTKDDKDFDFVSKISKSAQPSKADIIRYKCWLEQKYRSPYTGEMIPLAKLFTSAYEIEHVIPQSRYFDDSFSNKVICEAEVNKLKDRQLGFEFIKNHKGEKVQISQGKVVEILSVEAYEKFVKDHYSSNRTKMKKLLMDDIPDGFIERQLNDSRYISKLVKGLLSNIVREKLENGEYEQEAVSKNLISCNGSITDRLKKDWGMNDVWNSIVLPRFRRLNELTGKNYFTATSTEGHEIPAMPLELQKGFNKKRIDHRHHAMDAIVIACATRSHIQYLNNESAKTENRKLQVGLAKQLCSFKEVEFKKKVKNENGVWVESEEKIKKNVPDKFLKPWDSFTTDAKQVLENIIVSFKQNLRVINKTTNSYQHYDENGKKVMVKQEKGDSWTIRKSMHKDTGWGEVNNLRIKKKVSLNKALKNPKAIVNKDFKAKVLELLKENRDAKYIKKYVEDNKDVWSDIDIKKIEVYYYTKDTKDRYFATRFMSDLVGYMSGIKDYEKALDKIEGITDTGIQKILKAHLQAKDNNPELAFSADGIDEMNRNIVELNSGKPHKPIYKVRRFESGNKYSIGQTGCKAKKFVEADKGTNLFFAIFGTEKENKKTGEKETVRSYLTIPLNVMIDCQKKYGSQWCNNIESYLQEQQLVANDAKLMFILSPNDLVYLPTKEELKDGIKLVDKKRIYKFIDPNSDKGNFVPYSSANVIFSINFTDQKKKGISYPIQDEFGVGSQASKNPRAITDEMIKETCLPIKVDRLGNIIELNGKIYEQHQTIPRQEDKSVS